MSILDFLIRRRCRRKGHVWTSPALGADLICSHCGENRRPFA